MPKQSQVNAENALALGQVVFSTILLRRENQRSPETSSIFFPTNLPAYTLENSIEEALQRRPEIKTAELTVEQAKQAVTIARSGYYPLGLPGRELLKVGGRFKT